MKLPVLVWLLLMPSLVAAAEPKLPSDVAKQLQWLRTRCAWTVSIPGMEESTPFLRLLDSVTKTHPLALAKIGEFWDAKATRDLTPTLDLLWDLDKEYDTSAEVRRQFGLYYYENLDAIRVMVERVSSRPEEAARQ